MKDTAKYGWVFPALSVIAPLLYLSMYLPIWNGNELRADGVLVNILILFQCISFLLASVRIGLSIFKKQRPQMFGCASDIVAVLSILLLCFYGTLFMLLLFGIEWFPAQR